MHDGTITILCKNDLSDVERLQHTVSQFADLHGIGKRFQHAFNLAIDEIVTNIIRHGYDTSEVRQIKVEVELRGKEVTARIEDDGREFSPVAHPPVDCSKPMEERQLGGLGIHLVRSLVTRMEYQREGGKNVLTLIKRVQ